MASRGTRRSHQAGAVVIALASIDSVCIAHALDIVGEEEAGGRARGTHIAAGTGTVTQT